MKNKITPKLQAAYDKVETLRKASPTASTLDLAKKAGVHLSYYYKAKKDIEGAAKKPVRGPYNKKNKNYLPEAHVLPTNKQTPLIALVGTPAEVMNALSSFIG